MDSRDYQQQALLNDRNDYDSFTSKITGKQMRMMHAAMGISGEVGELIDVIKKHILYGKELDTKHLLEESGDVMWYFSILFDTLGTSFEEIMAINNAKLKKRYPQGFTEANALERLDKQ